MAKGPGVADLEHAFRAEWGAVVATLARRLGDLQAAEDATAEAFAAAAAAWPKTGVPPNPGGWLTVTAWRKAVDAHRRANPVVDPQVLSVATSAQEAAVDEPLGDDRLGLIFACCHPALALEVRVALTLRYVAGLTTKEIAAAFLVPEATLAQRLVRAKRKIREAGIRFEAPAPARLTERLASVRTVVYLVFNEGFAATGDAGLIRGELCEEAIWLGRLLHFLLPADAETAGLLALMLLHQARAAARTGQSGKPVPLAEQDRSRWDAALIAEGTRVLDEALARRTPGTYQLQAAIVALHSAAATVEDTDWPQIALLYGSLARLDPSPVVAVNRAVAVGMADGPLAGLAVLEPVLAAGTLEGYSPLHAAHADLLEKAGYPERARGAWARAAETSAVPALRDELLRRHENSLPPGCRFGGGAARRESMKLSSTSGGRAVSPPLVLALTSVSFFMVALDALVVVTALPSIHRSIGGSIATLEWAVNAYGLTFAAGIITCAALGDRLGRRRVYVAGLAVFTAASAACAVAPDSGALIAARAVQGLGAAAITPLALTILVAAFPPSRRGAIVGIFGGISGLAIAGGPLVGGAVVQGLDWHWIFWINVPIGLLAVAGSAIFLPSGRGPAARLDLPAVPLVAGGAAALAWALVRVGDAGWGDVKGIVAFVVGAALLAGFVLRERTAAEPMLPLRLFRIRAFSAAGAATFLMSGAIFSAAFLTAQYFQLGLGYSPLDSGLRLLPWTATPMVVAPLAGALADRIGTRPLLAVGLLLQAAGLAWVASVASVASVTAGGGYGRFVAPLVVAGVGVSMAIPTTSTAALGAVPAGDVGRASGVSNTMQRFGAAFGIALVTAVFAAHGHLGSVASFTAGYRPAMVVSAGISLLGAVAAMAIGRREAAPAGPAPVTAQDAAADARSAVNSGVAAS